EAGLSNFEEEGVRGRSLAREAGAVGVLVEEPRERPRDRVERGAQRARPSPPARNARRGLRGLLSLGRRTRVRRNPPGRPRSETRPGRRARVVDRTGPPRSKAATAGPACGDPG